MSLCAALTAHNWHPGHNLSGLIFNEGARIFAAGGWGGFKYGGGGWGGAGEAGALTPPTFLVQRCIVALGIRGQRQDESERLRGKLLMKGDYDLDMSGHLRVVVGGGSADVE